MQIICKCIYNALKENISCRSCPDEVNVQKTLVVHILCTINDSKKAAVLLVSYKHAVVSEKKLYL